MSDDLDPTKICRDEKCEILEVHEQHRRLKRRAVLNVEPHHRPKPDAALSIEDGRKPGHHELLSERVELAIGVRPTMMMWIQRDVRDDYGVVNDRTIYRYVRRLVQTKRVVKLDLGLAFSVYIKPGSKHLDDLAELREYMLANADCIPVSTRGSFNPLHAPRSFARTMRSRA